MTEAEKLIAKLIDDKKITGEEAVILLTAGKEYVYVNTWNLRYPEITCTPNQGITYATQPV